MASRKRRNPRRLRSTLGLGFDRLECRTVFSAAPMADVEFEMVQPELDAIAPSTEPMLIGPIAAPDSQPLEDDPLATIGPIASDDFQSESSVHSLAFSIESSGTVLSEQESSTKELQTVIQERDTSISVQSDLGIPNFHSTTLGDLRTPDTHASESKQKFTSEISSKEAAIIERSNRDHGLLKPSSLDESSIKDNSDLTAAGGTPTELRARYFDSQASPSASDQVRAVFRTSEQGWIQLIGNIEDSKSVDRAVDQSTPIATMSESKYLQAMQLANEDLVLLVDRTNIVNKKSSRSILVARNIEDNRREWVPESWSFDAGAYLNQSKMEGEKQQEQDKLRNSLVVIAVFTAEIVKQFRTQSELRPSTDRENSKDY